MPEVSRLVGLVEVQGIDKSTRELLVFGQTFDRAGTSADAHAKQLSGSFDGVARSSQHLAQQTGALGGKIELQNRQLDIMRQELEQAISKEGAESIATQKGVAPGYGQK